MSLNYVLFNSEYKRSCVGVKTMLLYLCWDLHTVGLTQLSKLCQHKHAFMCVCVHFCMRISLSEHYVVIRLAWRQPWVYQVWTMSARALLMNHKLCYYRNKTPHDLHGNESISLSLTKLQMDRKQILIISFNPLICFIFWIISGGGGGRVHFSPIKPLWRG